MNGFFDPKRSANVMECYSRLWRCFNALKSRAPCRNATIDDLVGAALILRRSMTLAGNTKRLSDRRIVGLGNDGPPAFGEG